MGYVSESTQTYAIVRDEASGRWVIGGGSALPTTGLQFPPPEGALFNLSGVLYTYTSGSWVVWDPTFDDVSITDDLTVGGDLGVTGTITSASYLGDAIDIRDAAVPNNTARFHWLEHTFTFSGDGTQTQADFLQENSHFLFAYTLVGVTIAGDSVARIDVGDGSDPDRFTPTQRSTLTDGSGLAEPIPSASQIQTALGDLTISAFEADGTTPCDPTSGTMTVRIFAVQLV